jgi:hypothetical protein
MLQYQPRTMREAYTISRTYLHVELSPCFLKIRHLGLD